MKKSENSFQSGPNLMSLAFNRGVGSEISCIWAPNGKNLGGGQQTAPCVGQKTAGVFVFFGFSVWAKKPANYQNIHPCGLLSTILHCLGL